MEARAVCKYVRVSPFKARQVADIVRKKTVDEALSILTFTPRKAAKLILKVLNSAVANAAQKDRAGARNLVVKNVIIDEGPTMRRFKPRAMGRATRIRKRMSHITVHLTN